MEQAKTAALTEAPDEDESGFFAKILKIFKKDDEN
jgi:hypothetical protein